MKKRLISIFLCVIVALSLVGRGFIDGFKDGVEKVKQEKSENN